METRDNSEKQINIDSINANETSQLHELLQKNNNLPPKIIQHIMYFSQTQDNKINVQKYTEVVKSIMDNCDLNDLLAVDFLLSSSISLDITIKDVIKISQNNSFDKNNVDKSFYEMMSHIIDLLYSVDINTKNMAMEYIRKYTMYTISPISIARVRSRINKVENYFKYFQYILKYLNYADNPSFAIYFHVFDYTFHCLNLYPECKVEKQLLFYLDALKSNAEICFVEEKDKAIPDIGNCLHQLFEEKEVFPKEKWLDIRFNNKGELITSPFFTEFLENNKDFFKRIYAESINPLSTEDSYIRDQENMIRKLRRSTRKNMPFIQNIETALDNKLDDIASIKIKKENSYYMNCIRYNKIEFKFSNYIQWKNNDVSLDKPKIYKILIYGDKFYYVTKKNKIIPLTIQIASYYPVIEEIMKRYLIFLSKKNGNLFLRELCEIKWQDLLVPLTINEIEEYYNWNHLFKKKYKAANEIQYNFNKHNPTFDYLLLKAYKMVDDTSKNYLQQMTEDDFGYLENKEVINTPEKLIISYYTKKLNINIYSNDYIYLKDYVYIKRRLKGNNKQISLMYKSKRRIIEEHNKANLSLKTQDIILKKVKKDSQFNNLREILPEEFEWIKTGKRLAWESTEMKHCVASYDRKIKEDRCAIYSFVFKEDGNRYTIEFLKKNNKYYVSQVFGRFDYYNKKAWDYVNDVLNSSQK